MKPMKSGKKHQQHRTLKVKAAECTFSSVIRVTKKSKVKNISLRERADHASSKRMGPYKHKDIRTRRQSLLNNMFIYYRPVKENICTGAKETQSEIKPF